MNIEKIKRALWSQNTGFPESDYSDEADEWVHIETEKQFYDYMLTSVSDDIDDSIYHLSEICEGGGGASEFEVLDGLDLSDYLDKKKIQEDVLKNGYIEKYIKVSKIKIVEKGGIKFYIYNTPSN